MVRNFILLIAVSLITACSINDDTIQGWLNNGSQGLTVSSTDEIIEIDEGSSASVTLVFSAPLTATTEISWSLDSPLAEFNKISGTLVLDAGQTTGTFQIQARADGVIEGNRAYTLTVSSKEISNTPVAVVNGENSAGKEYITIDAGYQHTCGLTSDGRAYCWGSNQSGGLGDSSTTSSPTPVAVSNGENTSGSRYHLISVGYDFTCGITGKGKSYCWGWAQPGTLGHGSQYDEYSPVEVSNGENTTGDQYKLLSAGYYQTCGSTHTGKAFCWGQGFSGALGNGNNTNSATPVAVANGENTATTPYVSTTNGFDFSCGLTADGTVYCWGGGLQGQLGNGASSSSSVPIQVDWP